ncbi:hypothetical protein Pmani_021363 [Petrolisthes manimaculis]|uniref:Uncharacterized protein n=1 Tax=Petrolisthes manimaculis TaxID=1843537 RepID=A0AAE1PGF9_9EUCA|nr:hypothetical protein Pmani_021363 [Petrolisthes manimaculis]
MEEVVVEEEEEDEVEDDDEEVEEDEDDDEEEVEEDEDGDDEEEEEEDDDDEGEGEEEEEEDEEKKNKREEKRQEKKLRQREYAYITRVTKQLNDKTGYWDDFDWKGLHRLETGFTYSNERHALRMKELLHVPLFTRRKDLDAASFPLKYDNRDYFSKTQPRC